MTDDTMALRTLLEKSPDADFLREMIGFAAERLMELEVAGLTGASSGSTSAMAIATGPGRHGPGVSSCASPSFGKARTFQAFLNHAGWLRKH